MVYLLGEARIFCYFLIAVTELHKCAGTKVSVLVCSKPVVDPCSLSKVLSHAKPLLSPGAPYEPMILQTITKHQ